MARTEEVRVPDIGDFDEVDVVEVLVAVGDRVAVDDPLITLESDKASMEVPSTVAGAVKELLVAVGDKVGGGDVIATVETEAEPAVEEPQEVAAAPPAAPASTPASTPASEGAEAKPDPRSEAAEPVTGEGAPAPAEPGRPPVPAEAETSDRPPPVHASPSVRRYARILGADLSRIDGSGRKGRILKEDVEAFVKRALQEPQGAGGGAAIPAVPVIDFAKFGEVEAKPLSRIRSRSAKNVHRSWLNVPLVTQFDEADITEMEAFRKAESPAAEARGFKLTPLVFIMRAVVAALKEFPDFNSSLDASGEGLILKKYFHLGIAVDTPEGLVVPVIRDVDQKGLLELAAELAEVSGRAREGKMRLDELQGGCFSISSLGGIGGTAFTPIVNAPEVAILGVSRSAWKPVHQDGTFVPRLLLPLSLSYDHRVIDGAAAVRFTTFLSRLLADTRRLLL